MLPFSQMVRFFDETGKPRNVTLLIAYILFFPLLFSPVSPHVLSGRTNPSFFVISAVDDYPAQQLRPIGPNSFSFGGVGTNAVRSHPLLARSTHQHKRVSAMGALNMQNSDFHRTC